jgi:rubrerythrin
VERDGKTHSVSTMQIGKSEERGTSGQSGGPGAPPRKLELYCAECRYGVIVRIAPDACPMCLSSAWVIERVLPARDA